MSEQYAISECRACFSKNLVPIISLGDQYITNFVDSEEDHKRIPKVPLDLIICTDCKILQLRHNATAESMWDEQYWYKSGISTTIKADLKDIVESSLKLANLNEKDIIVDIGSNDGTLLSFYDKKFDAVGFEPSKNVANEAKSKGFKVINDFFNAGSYKKEFGDKKAKLITAISMFYDLEDPNQFLRDIISVLDKDGLFVIQQNYLATMLQYNAFDNICHEHREYYSFTALRNLLEKHGLEIFDVGQSAINGGSIRTYIRKKREKEYTPIDPIKRTFEEMGLGVSEIGLSNLGELSLKISLSKLGNSKNTSLNTLRKSLSKFDLAIEDIEFGENINLYLKLNSSNSIKPFDGAEKRIRDIISMEEKMELNTMKPYLEFAARIDKIKSDLLNFLKQEKAKGKKIWIYGASTRGNVILQYFDLGPDMIEAIADKNADKYGKKTVGSLIPIFSPEVMRKANPDYLIVNTWHFFEEIRTQEMEYHKNGGILIAPLPELKIVKYQA